MTRKQIRAALLCGMAFANIIFLAFVFSVTPEQPWLTVVLLVALNLFGYFTFPRRDRLFTKDN